MQQTAASGSGPGAPQEEYGLFETAADATRQFITFTIGTEEYGVDIMAVKEIRGWVETTSLPKAPDHVRGVINLRGSIVPIYDLRTRFGLGVTEATRTHVVIIVTVGERIAGVLVDTVSDILTVTAGDIRPVPDLDGGTESAFLRGLVALEERMVTLIDIEKLLHGDVAEIHSVN
jgi:purine-binding chemotaxis protein CheW